MGRVWEAMKPAGVLRGRGSEGPLILVMAGIQCVLSLCQEVGEDLVETIIPKDSLSQRYLKAEVAKPHT